MRNRRFILPCLLAGFLAAQTAAATSFGLFQHGGRAMGQRNPGESFRAARSQV